MSLPDRMNAWMNPLPSRRRLLGLACVGLLAVSTSGCFQPMYKQTATDGTALSEKLSQIEVVFVAGRVGNEVRNDLIFALTGGAGNPAGAPYRLELTVRDSTTTAAVVDSLSGIPEVELVSVDVSWRLFDTTKPLPAGKPPTPIAQGSAFGKASLDSGYQRFARSRAIRDAQNRASDVAAETIKTQVVSYLIAPAASAEPPAPATPAAPAPATNWVATPTKG